MVLIKLTIKSNYLILGGKIINLSFLKLGSAKPYSLFDYIFIVIHDCMTGKLGELQGLKCLEDKRRKHLLQQD